MKQICQQCGLCSAILQLKPTSVWTMQFHTLSPGCTLDNRQDFHQWGDFQKNFFLLLTHLFFFFFFLENIPQTCVETFGLAFVFFVLEIRLGCLSAVVWMFLFCLGASRRLRWPLGGAGGLLSGGCQLLHPVWAFPTASDCGRLAGSDLAPTPSQHTLRWPCLPSASAVPACHIEASSRRKHVTDAGWNINKYRLNYPGRIVSVGFVVAVLVLKWKKYYIIENWKIIWENVFAFYLRHNTVSE